MESSDCQQSNDPVLLVRRHAVLLCFPPIKTIVTADKLMLLVPNGADSLLYLLHDHLNGASLCVYTYVYLSFSLALSHTFHFLNFVDFCRYFDEGILESKADDSDIDPEGAFYQALFATILSLHSQEYINIETRVQSSLRKLRGHVDVPLHMQEHITGLKNVVAGQLLKNEAYTRLLLELLRDDVALGYMHLTLLKSRPDFYNDPNAVELSHNDDIKV